MNNQITIKEFNALTHKSKNEIIRKNPEAIVFLDRLTESLVLTAIRANTSVIRYITTPSIKMIETALTHDIKSIEFIKDHTEEVQSLVLSLCEYRDLEFIVKALKQISDENIKEIIGKDGCLIKLIKNPSEKVQLKALGDDGEAIEFIKNPSEKVQLKAIKIDGANIRFIKNPSEKLQLEAVSDSDEAIRYIKNPSEKVQLASVQHDYTGIRYIKNPSKKVQLASVQHDTDSLTYIDNPCEEAMLLAFKSDPFAIKYIKNPSDEMKRRAILLEPLCLNYIKYPSKELKLLALKTNGTVIRKIKNPTEEMMMIAVRSAYHSYADIYCSRDMHSLSQSDLRVMEEAFRVSKGAVVNDLKEHNIEITPVMVKLARKYKDKKKKVVPKVTKLYSLNKKRASSKVKERILKSSNFPIKDYTNSIKFIMGD